MEVEALATHKLVVWMPLLASLTLNKTRNMTEVQHGQKVLTSFHLPFNAGDQLSCSLSANTSHLFTNF